MSIATPEGEKWNSYPGKIRGLIRVLQLFDIKPFRPLLLAIARRFAPKEAAEAFQRLVTYGVRLIIAASTRSGSVEQPLARVANQVFEGHITTAREMTCALNGIVLNDDLFLESFTIASVSQAKFARYYLRSLELAAANEPDPWLIPNDDPDAVNLEHVLPLKPMENWPNYDDDMDKQFSRRIGNLALMKTKPNSDLRSASFEEKRPFLADSPFQTTNMISEVSECTPEEIVARQEKLALLAVKAWPLT